LFTVATRNLCAGWVHCARVIHRLRIPSSELGTMKKPSMVGETGTEDSFEEEEGSEG
jgi:hypothetical protein